MHWHVSVVLAAIATVHASGADLQPAQAQRTEVVLLGTGTPVPDPRAWGPASAVLVGKRLFVVDAGAGVTRQLAAAGFPRVHDVEATFITHLHSDHTLGYPDLIFTTWIMGRRAPLVVFGPPGLRRMTDKLMEAWSEDLEVRIKGLERESDEWLKVDAREVVPGVIYDRDRVRVTAIGVAHGNWAHAFGFRFDTPDRSITFAGDTAPSRALAEAAKGTDVLVHEVYVAKRLKPEERPGGEFWPEYMRRFHTSDEELGRLAAEIRPKLLLLDHVMLLGGTEEELVRGIRAGGYTGRVEIGRDLGRY